MANNRRDILSLILNINSGCLTSKLQVFNFYSIVHFIIFITLFVSKLFINMQTKPDNFFESNNYRSKYIFRDIDIIKEATFFTLTLLVKNTLFTGLWLFGWIHESQVNCTGPFGKPSRTMLFRNTSLLSSFCTKTAPTFPKATGNSNVASYCTSSSFVDVLCTLPFAVFISELVSSFIENK